MMREIHRALGPSSIRSLGNHPFESEFGEPELYPKSAAKPLAPPAQFVRACCHVGYGARDADAGFRSCCTGLGSAQCEFDSLSIERPPGTEPDGSCGV